MSTSVRRHSKTDTRLSHSTSSIHNRTDLEICSEILSKTEKDVGELVEFFSETRKIVRQHIYTIIAISSLITFALCSFVAFGGPLYEIDISAYISNVLDSAAVSNAEIYLKPNEPSGILHIPEDVITEIHDAHMKAASDISFIWTQGGALQLRFIEGITATDTYPPLHDVIFDGIFFGVSSWNPWNYEGNPMENELRTARIRDDMKMMNIPPVKIYACTWTYGELKWRGLVGQFTLQHLGDQKHSPREEYNGSAWTDVRESMLHIARKYKQYAVYEWYPNVFDDADAVPSFSNKLLVQKVLPALEGYESVASKVEVHKV